MNKQYKQLADQEEGEAEGEGNSAGGKVRSGGVWVRGSEGARMLLVGCWRAGLT